MWKARAYEFKCDAVRTRHDFHHAVAGAQWRAKLSPSNFSWSSVYTLGCDNLFMDMTSGESFEKHGIEGCWGFPYLKSFLVSWFLGFKVSEIIELGRN